MHEITTQPFLRSDGANQVGVRERFRRLNKQIVRHDAPTHRWIALDLVCECADETCFCVVQATVADLSRGIVVTPGHEDTPDLRAAA